MELRLTYAYYGGGGGLSPPLPSFFRRSHHQLGEVSPTDHIERHTLALPLEMSLPGLRLAFLAVLEAFRTEEPIVTTGNTSQHVSIYIYSIDLRLRSLRSSYIIYTLYPFFLLRHFLILLVSACIFQPLIHLLTSDEECAPGSICRLSLSSSLLLQTQRVLSIVLLVPYYHQEGCYPHHEYPSASC